MAKTPPTGSSAHALSHPLAASERAKWRAIPEDLGPWWRAAQILHPLVRAGVWSGLLGLVPERGVQLGMVFLDGTNMRAHQKAAASCQKGGSGPERDARELLAAHVADLAPRLA